jgi:hypothetical protein
MQRDRTYPVFCATRSVVRVLLIGVCVACILRGAAAGAEPAASTPPVAKDDLIDAQLRQKLEAYLEDIDKWIMGLDVGSGTLKGTRDTSTSIFINGNFARVLMASCKISGNKAYLDEALRWCDGFCKQQEHTTTSDGRPAGFWSDLGPGKNIYFGDGGTAATALAIGYRFGDAKRKAVYRAAMENMARFVMNGSSDDPQGKGRKATKSFVIADGPDEGALGCGYYLGHLSIEPYTISTATTGGAFFSSLYAIAPKPEYRDVALGATKWLLKIRKADGEFPYILDGKTEKQWPLDTLSYCTEAFVAVDTHIKDPGIRARLHEELRPTVRWLLAGQNPDGSWGKLRSADQQRSPRVVTLLSWYYRQVNSDPKVAASVQRYCRFLLDPANSRAYGVNDLVRTTGFVGLVVADLIAPGSSF